MKTDSYTKIVLTVIAIALCMNVFQQLEIVTVAKASDSRMVYLPVNEDGSVSVRLSNHQLLDVNIAEITTNDELDVNIDEVGGSWVSSGGPIKVEIK